MGMDILKETGASRSPGFTPKNGEVIYPGLVCIIDSNEQVVVYANKTYEPSGLALESNVLFPYFGSTAPAGTPIGDGYDFLQYNRGGLIALFRNGGEVLLYDDKRAAAGASHPVDYTQAYNIGDKLYASQTGGKVTSELDTDRKQIGVVEKVVGSGADLVLKMRLAGTLA